jgi:hypothetical protein
MSGIVIKIKSGMKLVLSVSLLQRSVAVEIDRSWISPAQAVKPTADQVSSSRFTSISMDLGKLITEQGFPGQAG